MAAWLAFATVLQLSDRFVITYVLGSADAGYYAAIYEIVTRGVSMLLIPLILTAHPIIMQLYNQGLYGQAFSRCRQLIVRQILLTAVVVTIMAVGSGSLVAVSGVNPRGNETALVALLALSAGLWQIGLAAHKPFEMRSHTKQILGFMVVAAATNMAANVLFLKSFGVMVAAYSSVGGSLIYIALAMGGWRGAIREVSARSGEVDIERSRP